jgi:hypothetical protein
VHQRLSFQFTNLQQLLNKDWKSDVRWHNIYTKLIPLIDGVCLEDKCRISCVFVVTDLMNTLHKCSRAAHFCSLIMYTWISGVIAYYGFLPMRWFHHQSQLGADRCSLRCLVGWLRRKLPVKFRRHQTSYLSHVFSAVSMKSQFDIYFTSRETQLNVTSYTCSK